MRTAPNQATKKPGAESWRPEMGQPCCRVSSGTLLQVHISCKHHLALHKIHSSPRRASKESSRWGFPSPESSISTVGTLLSALGSCTCAPHTHSRVPTPPALIRTPTLAPHAPHSHTPPLTWVCKHTPHTDTTPHSHMLAPPTPHAYMHLFTHIHL